MEVAVGGSPSDTRSVSVYQTWVIGTVFSEIRTWLLLVAILPDSKDKAGVRWSIHFVYW